MCGGGLSRNLGRMLATTRTHFVASMAATLALLSALPGSASADWLQPSDAPLDAIPAMSAGAPALTYDGTSLVAAWPEAGSKANPMALRISRLGLDTRNTWKPLPGIEDGVISDVRAGVAGGRPVLAYATRDGASAPSRVVVARLGESGAWDSSVVTTGPQRGATQPALAVLGGAPYVARIVDDGPRPSVRVASAIEGGGWTSVGGPLSTGANPDSPALVASGGALTVAWIETAADGKRVVRAAHLNTAGVWISDDVPSARPGLAPVDVAVYDVGGRPWVTVGEAGASAGDAMAELFFPGRPNEFVGHSILQFGGVLPEAPQVATSGAAQFVGVRLANGDWKAVTFTAAVRADVGTVGDARGTSLLFAGGHPWAAWVEHPGSANPDVRVGALVPTIFSQGALATDASAQLHFRVRDFAVPTYLRVEASGKGEPAPTTEIGLTNGNDVPETLFATLGGLAPQTTYGWRVSADLGIATVGYPAQTFTTPVVAGPGPKGDRGETGPQGERGADGAQGVAGAAGATGVTGSAGADGAKGATGATGADGAKGATGERGPKGDKGEPGKVVCRRAARLVCDVLLAPGTWTTDATATLARAGVRVARPSARIDHGRLRLQVIAVHLRPGVYRLRVTARHGHARRTILEQTLTIR
jgi:hypothetical protein